MKETNRLISVFAACLLIAMTVVAAACGDSADDSGGAVDSTALQNQKIIQDYADQVVVPTYQLLADRAGGLKSAVDVLQKDPTEANLKAARQAWVDTRLPWEQSEMSIFGPVDDKGFDPALDSWPVNRQDIDDVITSEHSIDRSYVETLDPGVKGFHTIEFLLFGDGGDKVVGDFDARTLTYLQAASAELKRVTDRLAESWTDGIDGQPAYRHTFTTAGNSANQKFPSVSAAGQKIVTGMLGILNEVATGKMGNPLRNRDTSKVESQFSYNSLTDFTNNIIGVQNAYLGRVDAAQTSGMGLTNFVQAHNAQLDERVRDELTAAIEALQAVPEPFRNTISNQEARARAEKAIEAISTVQTTVAKEVQPLVTGH